MAKPRTWFERQHADSMKDPEYAQAYQEARADIDAVDAAVAGVIRELEAERRRQGMSKSELAKRSLLPSVSVRRLLTAEDPDPKLSTLVPLAMALGRPVLGFSPPVAPYLGAGVSRPRRKAPASAPTARKGTSPTAALRKGGKRLRRTSSGAAT